MSRKLDELVADMSHAFPTSSPCGCGGAPSNAAEFGELGLTDQWLIAK